MRIKSLVASALAVASATAITVGVVRATGDTNSIDAQPRVETLPPLDLASERLSADDAIAFWQKRVDQNPADLLSRIQLSSTYLRRGGEQHNTVDALTANTEIDKVLAVVPNDMTALRVKANARAFIHKFAEALDYGRRVLAIDPTDSTGQAIVGDAQYELGHLAAAEKIYVGLADRLGDAPEITARLARLNHAQGNDESAVRYAAQAEQRARAGGYNRNDLAYYDILNAELARGEGRYEDAAKEFADALELRPDYGVAIEGLGKVRAAQGRLDEAERYWKQSGKLIGAPDFHVLSALGDIELARGNEMQARQYWSQALDAVDSLSADERIGFLRDESRFRASRGLDVSFALQLAEQDFKGRQDALALDTLAWAQFANGDIERARVSIDKALASGVREAFIWYHAAEIYAAGGDRDGARMYVDKALDLSPHFDLYESAKAVALRAQLS
jgi:tetratricopeptide (TPR) repeat protein